MSNENKQAAVPSMALPEDLKPIQTKHLAVRFGMKQTQLRRVLRSMPEYADGVHTNYRWAEKDPAIARIEAAIARIAKAKQERAAEAKAKLEARAAALAKQEALNKAAAEAAAKALAEAAKASK